MASNATGGVSQGRSPGDPWMVFGVNIVKEGLLGVYSAPDGGRMTVFRVQRLTSGRRVEQPSGHQGGCSVVGGADLAAGVNDEQNGDEADHQGEEVLQRRG